MATSRVGEVQLRLRVPATLAAQTDQIRATVERELLVRILEQLERLLHARYGEGAVIRIRRIATRWSLDALELTSIDIVTRLAAELAEVLVHELESLAPGERLRPRSESVALFASEHHADAAYLADVVDGLATTTWIHTRRDPQVTWAAIAVAGGIAVEETLQHLIAMERLAPALALAAPDILAQVAATAPAHLAPAIRIAVARAGVRHAAARGTPLAQPPANVQAPTLERTSPSTERPTDATVSATAEPSTSDSRVLESVDSVESHQPVQARETALELPATSSTEDNTRDTQLAGVFYLAGRVLEIELAERLWAAGLPEGDVLVQIATAIVGATNDPAPAWFGGIFERPPAIPDVPAWAMTEVVEAVQHALGRRLVRHGVTSSPAALDEQLERLARDVPVPGLPPNLGRIVARGVASLCTMVAAQLERAPSLDELRAICTRPGRLVCTEETLHVIMSDAYVDVDHRRAGLDHDPGRLPWLGRDLKIEFTSEVS